MAVLVSAPAGVSFAETGTGDGSDSPFFDPNQSLDPQARPTDEIVQAACPNVQDPFILEGCVVRLVRRLAQRLGGATPLVDDLSNDPYYSQIKTWIYKAYGPTLLGQPDVTQRQSDWKAQVQGYFEQAAAAAINYPNFLNITVKNFFKPLTIRDPDPNAALNDATMMGIGFVKDDRDMREFLTTSDGYVQNGNSSLLAGKGVPATTYYDNTGPAALEAANIDLGSVLNAVPQSTIGYYPNGMPPAGVFTTRAWAVLAYSQGTNRRAVERALQYYLCTPIETIRATGMPTGFITRDVTRLPGGNSDNYTNKCRTCHDILDAARGAFAYMNFLQNDVTDIRKGGTVQYTAPNVVPKINVVNNNPGMDISPVYTDFWNNAATLPQQSSLGWSAGTPQHGNGVQSLGAMYANSQAFAACWPRRAVAYMCNMDPARVPQAVVDDLTGKFINGGYKLSKLLQQAAVLENCLGR